MSVEVINLTKKFGNQKAVDDISFSAKSGEILGFLGPNGAGKSTTMKIATCYLQPSSGEVRVSGSNVVEHPLRIRKKVGYLPEHNPLYLDMYVHEYLNFIASVHGLSGSLKKDRINDMVNLCGLESEQNKKIGQLSKGYRQRVGLAQSLIHDPEVLILDEPTTGLDPNQIVEIRNVIRQISKEKTVIFSTHIMQEVQALCDRVVIINKGVIVADSKVADLKTTADYDILKLEFKELIDTTPIMAFDSVIEINQTNELCYELKVHRGIDLRSELFALATKHNWPLVGLNQVEGSLEEVFRELTQKEVKK
ncbi:MAG: gliding motility-associated ABC transporter ATP-binding subunit GldA [Bacteroidetes bacterium]|nr:gliding motility-associated ABC transporter ATP-binding subunit GldA [Bacteroidota bacterium]MDA1121703.1 gliding motility-associated ABC transporter ATP-binding subunit GldA [Bacteroidota bacterium]